MLPVALLLAAAVTGTAERGYEVQAPENLVEVGPGRVSVRELATTFQPRMMLDAATPSPRLLWIWLEAVDVEGRVDLIYHWVWENEIHPEKTVNRMYALFRAAYFGYPLYDIEFFQVSLDRETGNLLGALFETACEQGFFQPLPQHCSARIERRPDGGFLQEIRSKEGRLLSSGEISPSFKGSRLTAAVQTWNHLSVLLTDSELEQASWQEVSAPLKPLSAEDFASHKFSRKSQGDYKTHDSKAVLAGAAVGFWLLLALGPVAMWRGLRRVAELEA